MRNKEKTLVAEITLQHPAPHNDYRKLTFYNRSIVISGRLPNTSRLRLNDKNGDRNRTSDDNSDQEYFRPIITIIGTKTYTRRKLYGATQGQLGSHQKFPKSNPV